MKTQRSQKLSKYLNKNKNNFEEGKGDNISLNEKLYYN